MRILELTLTALEPLIVTSGTSEGMAHTCLDYIPGNLLLGAFAARWINGNPGNPDASAEFQELFLNGNVSWGCAYPVCGDSESVPVPLCYMREKSMGGLPVYGAPFDRKKFAIFNLLPLRDEKSTLRDLWEERNGKSDIPPKFKKISATFMNPRTLRQPDIRKIWNTRVALEEHRSARPGQLFGFSALSFDTVFRTHIICRTEFAAKSLQKLLDAGQNIRVGHARSAGYGQVRTEARWKDDGDHPTETARDFNVFLLSQYMPDPAWANPLDDLLAKITRIAGSRPKMVKSFLAYNQIESYNSHWRRPRDSRIGLAAGSVLKLEFDSEISMPVRLELGGEHLEGYGRIMLNPDFLRDALPEIPDLPTPVLEAPAWSPDSTQGPVWRILRDRAIERNAQKQALLWLENENWKDFLKGAGDLKTPTASQRSNALRLSLEDFNKMLDKTPGRQWKEAIADNPFQPGGMEHLDKIMQNLLNPEVFLREFPPEGELILPGSPAEDAEKEKRNSRAHELFRRELVRTWNKQVRTREEEGK